jgi:hypothetical protein
MKRYIYVEVRDSQTEQGFIEHGPLLSFGHTVVEAPNEDEAYRIGQAVMGSAPIPTDPEAHNPSWPFLNDYVIEVP